MTPNTMQAVTQKSLKCNKHFEEDDLVKSTTDLDNALIKNALKGDLYAIGRIWIETLQNVLTGSKIPAENKATFKEAQKKLCKSNIHKHPLPVKKETVNTTSKQPNLIPSKTDLVNACRNQIALEFNEKCISSTNSKQKNPCKSKIDKHPITVTKNTKLKESDAIQSKTDSKNSFRSAIKGDLYVIGSLWIEALKSVLIGKNFIPLPKVEAAEKKIVPEKPKPMKSSDLPMYCNPVVEYKEYKEQESLCPDVNHKLLHSFLCPYVSCTRKCTQEFWGIVKHEIDDTYNEISGFLDTKKKRTISFMRDPCNLNIRYGVVGLGAIAGYYQGSKRGYPSKFLFTGLGLLATGALCFPEETDRYFKDFCFYSAKGLIGVYNYYCYKNFTMRERLPCKDEMPSLQPRKNAVKPNYCPENIRKK